MRCDESLKRNQNLTPPSLRPCGIFVVSGSGMPSCCLVYFWSETYLHVPIASDSCGHTWSESIFHGCLRVRICRTLPWFACLIPDRNPWSVRHQLGQLVKCQMCRWGCRLSTSVCYQRFCQSWSEFVFCICSLCNRLKPDALRCSCALPSCPPIDVIDEIKSSRI